eukprot:GHVS01077589.1.p1 GENE.GHVS01077589.1~~GHVS01077589.1.p1  ORF type:complete len:354 (-),score=64.03 GHVS01077589.1:144-1205(-)
MMKACVFVGCLFASSFLSFPSIVFFPECLRRTGTPPPPFGSCPFGSSRHVWVAAEERTVEGSGEPGEELLGLGTEGEEGDPLWRAAEEDAGKEEKEGEEEGSSGWFGRVKKWTGFQGGNSGEKTEVLVGQGERYFNQYNAEANQGGREVEGGCYAEVVSAMESLRVNGCENMTDGTKGLLALLITHCHFRKAKRKFPLPSDNCFITIVSHPYLPHTFSSALTDGRGVALQLPLEQEGEQEGEQDEAPYGSRSSSSSGIAVSVNPCQAEGTDCRGCEKVRQLAVGMCTEKLGDVAFTSYLSTLHHIDSICFFVQSKRWNDFVSRTLGQAVSLFTRSSSSAAQLCWLSIYLLQLI